MGLEGEAPAGMGEDVADDVVGVVARAGLQEEARRGQQVGDALDVLAFVDYLELVDAVDTPGGFLGGACHPVDAGGDGKGAVGLYLDVEAGAFERAHQSVVELKQGLAAGDHDVARGKCRYLPYNLGGAHLGVGREVGVAEGAAAVAAAETQKHGGCAGVESLALQRVEDFVYAIHVGHKSLFSDCGDM